MCVMFSPVNSIKYIYHPNKYLVRCLWKAYGNTGRSVWNRPLLLLSCSDQIGMCGKILVKLSMIRFHVFRVVTCGLTWMDWQRWKAKRHIYTLFIATLPNKFTILNAYCFYPVHLIYAITMNLLLILKLVQELEVLLQDMHPVHSYTRNHFEENCRCHWKGNW